MAQILFKNAKLLDPRKDALQGGSSVLVEGELIREVSAKPIKAAKAQVIDCQGRTLMPGLIDCHVHVMLSEVNIRYLEAIPLTMMTVRASALARAMIDRGFTTVRDTGGCDWGMRDGMNFCMEIADGPDAVRASVREQLRQGADQIKIMVSGGVASPYDPLDSKQFTIEEIRAAVEESEAFGRYTQAHAYTAEAITRAVSQGVRTIEHGNLIDEKAAALMKQKGAYLVANLVTYYAMRERAKDFGMTAEMLAKNDLVIDGGLKSLEICKRAGIPVGYGSDLHGQLQVDQSREFMFRREVLSPIEIIRQATLVGAEIVRMPGKLGVVKEGAFADLLVVDGDPIKKLELLTGQGENLSIIMKAGRFHKNRLTS